MEKRALARTGLTVAPLMLGGNAFGWTIDASTSFRILDRFADSGFNFIDTADVYSRWKPGNEGGESETILGQWFARSGKRAEIVLATKVGMDMGDERKGLSRHYIVSEVEASLRRLQTEYIDLYQSHIDDSSTPLEETLEAYRELVDAGKVRFIGASNYSGARLREAIELAGRDGLPVYQTLQPEFNLYAREKFETDQQPVCYELEVDVIPYFSLASGFLTGKYKSKADTEGKDRGSRVEKYFDDRGIRILKALTEAASAMHTSEATVALAWLMAQPTVLAPIASATSIEQLDDLLAAAELRLPEPILRDLDEASSYGQAPAAPTSWNR